MEWRLTDIPRSTELQTEPEQLRPEYFCGALTGEGLVWGGRHETVVTSTNTLARQAAEQGVAEGYLVTADHQTAGRGRGAHRWWCPPGAGLLASLVLRPTMLPAAQMFVLTELVALALVRGVEQTTGLQPGIKWPNDLWLDGRKLGGILIEAAIANGHARYAVAGWGLNVHQPAHDWPEALRDQAISLRQAGNQTVSRNVLLGATLACLEAEYRSLNKGGWMDLHTRWTARCITLGQEVEITRDGQSWRGRAMEAGLDGTLLLAQPDGRRIRIASGTVGAAQV